MIQYEHNEQVALFKWAKLNERKHPELKYLAAWPNGGLRDIRTAKRLKDEGVKPGPFDIHLDVARHGYHGLKIELKSGKGLLSDSQADWMAHYMAQGYKAVVCWGWEQARKQIEAYLCGQQRQS